MKSVQLADNVTPVVTTAAATSGPGYWLFFLQCLDFLVSPNQIRAA